MTRFTMLCLALVICTVTGALGQTELKQVTHYGFGGGSCGTWIEARAARSKGDKWDVRFLQGQEWVSGFLSAYNIYEHPRGMSQGGRIVMGCLRGLTRTADKTDHENT